MAKSRQEIWKEQEQSGTSLQVCKICKHNINGISCKAFDEIPNDIFKGKSKHESVRKGQKKDVIFELDEVFESIAGEFGVGEKSE